MTFSVAARCADSGMFGIAVSSSSPAVAARCAHARAGVGVVATQNITDPTLGPRGLDLLATGLGAEACAEALRRSGTYSEFRQFACVDAHGAAAGFSGSRCLGVHAMARSDGVICCGNLLENPRVPERMVAAFEATGGDLGERLMATLRAGLEAGGEAGPVHSAGLLLVRDVAWPVADLRVDWEENDPIAALQRLWERYQPQLEDYVTRALDPASAPGYGVPGDT